MANCNANNITFRLEKGSALTYLELDDNFRYLCNAINNIEITGGGGATFDDDEDTGMEVELTPDEDFVRFYTGNTIPGWSNQQSIMTLASNGFILNMGTSNTFGIYLDGNTEMASANTNANGTPFSVDGASIVFRAGYGSNSIFHANTIGGNIDLYPGGPNQFANTQSGNTSTPNTEGIVRVIGPTVNSQAIVRYFDSSTNNFVGIQSPANLVSTYTITLPVNSGFPSYVLTTDGNGNTRWSAVNTSLVILPDSIIYANTGQSNTSEGFGTAANGEVAIFAENKSIYGAPSFTFNSQNNTLSVTGTIEGTAKNFLIDHPNKSGWKLRHGSLEGPENAVYIRGRSKSHIIVLPEYWINFVDPESITVHLTPIGYCEELCVRYIEFESRKILVYQTPKFDYYYHIMANRIDEPILNVEYPL